MLMSTSPLNDSLINHKRKNTKDKILREGQIILIKSKTNRQNYNSISKFQPIKNIKSKKKKIEKRYTSRFLNNNLIMYERAKKDYLNIIKREKSADHLKNKSLSLRERIKSYFNEIGYYDSNNNLNTNKIQKMNNNSKNYNTLILIKKGKDDFLINKKRKSYFSPQRIDRQKKINFYKKLLNLRTVSNTKKNNNELYYYNFKENLNVNNNYLNNFDSNYASTMKSTFNVKNKNRNKNKNKKVINNNKEKHIKNYFDKKNKYNNLYFSKNNFNNIDLISQKKNKNKYNPLSKSSNINNIIQSKFKENQNVKFKHKLGENSM